MRIAPEVVWAIEFAGGRAADCSSDWEARLAARRGDFHWLHMSLVDQPTLRWIRESPELPAPLRDMLLSSERSQRAVVEEGWVGCVLHDVERDFDRLDAERTGTLRLVLGDRLIITARSHPLRSADIARRRIERGEARIANAAAALGHAISAIVDNISAVAGGHAAQMEEFEDALLERPETFDHRRLIHIRRRVVQFHRLLSGMRSVFRRLEQDADLPPNLRPTVEQIAQQLGEIDSDMLAIQSQLRLLREEADLQAAQRTNQNLYVLSILSALLLPATLVTGFFGMNTGGLPFTTGGGGTIEATLLAVGTSLGVYALLRVLGLVHKN